MIYGNTEFILTDFQAPEMQTQKAPADITFIYAIFRQHYHHDSII